MTTCTNMSCDEPATATVLVGATRLPKCFTHEREYADRYGAEDVRPLIGSGAGSWWRNGRHSNGAGLAEQLNVDYDGKY
jgi:hypothetical protein